MSGGLRKHQQDMIKSATRPGCPNTFWVPYGLGKGAAPKPLGRFTMNIPPRRVQGADAAAREDLSFICCSGRQIPMDYETFHEWLADMTPIAGACSARGGHMHYPKNPTKKRRSIHLVWVSKVSGARIRDIKKLLRGERIS